MGVGVGRIFLPAGELAGVAVAALRQPYTACVMSCAPSGLGVGRSPVGTAECRQGWNEMEPLLFVVGGVCAVEKIKKIVRWVKERKGRVGCKKCAKEEGGA